MTRPLNPVLLEEVNDLRAFYDALGGSWSQGFVGSEEDERARWVRFMWQEREHPTVKSLWQVFYRHLDVQDIEDSEGYDTDSTQTDQDSDDMIEPDSNEDADWFGQMTREDSEEELTESQEVEEEDVKEPEVKVEE
ncbi:hypothetical protein V5O48_013753 [Marasmius crinis-equi]|uniref:Uncharacterized protein n=1 Tax=Marasmius crinis-equi TaxID=585013 RepID=A0ABR3EZ94_9AGAR